jgi:hypothetical protein
MAHSIKEHLHNPVVQLREDLSLAERLAPQLNGGNIERFLLLMDRIEDRFVTIEESGMDLRSERSRQVALHSRLERLPGQVVSAATRVGGLAKLRAQHPPAEHFWWHLDQVVAERRWQTIRQLVISIGGVILFLGILYYAVETFFPPDPDVLLVSGATGNLHELAMEEEWEEALLLIQETKLNMTRPDAELLIWEGVVTEQLGMEAASEAALAEAREIVGQENEVLFWINLGNVRMMADNVAGAEAAALQALSIDAEEPQVYFLLANVAESRGNLMEAIENYELTFELAADTNPQLAVISRVRLGTLLQSGMGMSPFPEAEITPEAMP